MMIKVQNLTEKKSLIVDFKNLIIYNKEGINSFAKKLEFFVVLESEKYSVFYPVKSKESSELLINLIFSEIDRAINSCEKTLDLSMEKLLTFMPKNDSVLNSIEINNKPPNKKLSMKF